MSAGALRERIRFERKSRATSVYDDGDGGNEGWSEIVTVAADITPVASRDGGEQVIGERRLALNQYTIKVRQSRAILGVTEADRIVDTRNGERIFNIRQMDNPDKRDKFIMITAETGRQDGGA